MQMREKKKKGRTHPNEPTRASRGNERQLYYSKKRDSRTKSCGDDPALRGWVERFDAFKRWLDRVGYVLAGLPDWEGSTPVHVAYTPGIFYLERVTESELEAYRRHKRQGAWTSKVTQEKLRSMRCAKIYDADLTRLAEWRNGGGETS